MGKFDCIGMLNIKIPMSEIERPMTKKFIEKTVAMFNDSLKADKDLQFNCTSKEPRYNKEKLMSKERALRIIKNQSQSIRDHLEHITVDFHERLKKYHEYIDRLDILNNNVALDNIYHYHDMEIEPLEKDDEYLTTDEKIEGFTLDYQHPQDTWVKVPKQFIGKIVGSNLNVIVRRKKKIKTEQQDLFRNTNTRGYISKTMT